MKESTNALCQFLDASPTSFHATDNIRSYLLAHGAQELDEAALWQIEPGVPYFICRSGTSIVAFRAGLKSMKSYRRSPDRKSGVEGSPRCS